MRFINSLRAIPQDDSTSWGEKMLLYWLIRELRPEIVVETGTHKGATTQVLAHACLDNDRGMVYTCDPVDWKAIEHVNHIDLATRIVFMKCRGDALNVDGVDFAFIDGLHEAEEVQKELEHIIGRLKKGAVVVFHDCWPNANPELADVNSALKNIHATWLPTSHALRIYTHGEVFDKPQDWSLGGVYD